MSKLICVETLCVLNNPDLSPPSQNIEHELKVINCLWSDKKLIPRASHYMEKFQEKSRVIKQRYGNSVKMTGKKMVRYYRF